MKILVGMNLSPVWVDFLTASGFESCHWPEIGDPRSPDEEIMNWARRNEYVIFTNDLDFGYILALT
jgi:predicted nuclease of predicted toxin-antitoxin system